MYFIHRYSYFSPYVWVILWFSLAGSFINYWQTSKIIIQMLCANKKTSKPQTSAALAGLLFCHNEAYYFGKSKELLIICLRGISVLKIIKIWIVLNSRMRSASMSAQFQHGLFRNDTIVTSYVKIYLQS